MRKNVMLQQLGSQYMVFTYLYLEGFLKPGDSLNSRCRSDLGNIVLKRHFRQIHI